MYKPIIASVDMEGVWKLMRPIEGERKADS